MDRKLQYGDDDDIDPATVLLYSKTEEEVQSLTGADMSPVQEDLISHFMAALPARQENGRTVRMSIGCTNWCGGLRIERTHNQAGDGVTEGKEDSSMECATIVEHSRDNRDLYCHFSLCHLYWFGGFICVHRSQEELDILYHLIHHGSSHLIVPGIYSNHQNCRHPSGRQLSQLPLSQKLESHQGFLRFWGFGS